MLSCCFYSSFVFLMNSGLAGIHKYYLYSGLFFTLFATSLIVHSNTNNYTLLIDKIAIFAIVFYGGGLFALKCRTKNPCFCNLCITMMTMITISTFLLTIYLYYYGFLHKKYCYHPDNTIANLYHSLLHLISFIGHSLIITM
jgi:hypothetical protein